MMIFCANPILTMFTWIYWFSQEVKKWRNYANIQIHSAYPFVLYFPLVELHCDEFIVALSDRAMTLANRVLDKMAEDNKGKVSGWVVFFRWHSLSWC